MNLRAIKILVLSLVLVVLTGAERANAQTPPPSAYQVQAAFLYNFAKFVDWPATAFTNDTSPIVIGILGANPFGTNLENTIKNKTINNRKLEIKQVTSIAELRNCQIGFICWSERRRLKEIRDGLKGASVLTVGDGIDGFTQSGGMINFIIEEEQVHFEINDDNAKAAGLQISSKLLTLGKKRN